jgi:hypothetical protein
MQNNLSVSEEKKEVTYHRKYSKRKRRKSPRHNTGTIDSQMIHSLLFKEAARTKHPYFNQ